MYEISFADAPYRRRISALTETAALAGYSSARVCGNNQKRCTPGFAARTERGADCTLIIASPVRWWKKLDHIANDNYYHFEGPPGGVGLSTGRVGAEKGAFL